MEASSLSLEIQYAPVSELIPRITNARLHSEAQVAQIAGSIRAFGFVNPVLIDGEGTVIAGHGRLQAAQLLGLGEVPTIELPHLSPAQIRALVIADNKLALNASWDEEMLSAELQAIDEEGLTDLTGFSGAELDKLFGVKDGPDGVIEVGETIATEHQCPKCGYRWSGKSGGYSRADDDETDQAA